MPFVLLGDLNEDPNDIGISARLLQEGHIMDAGACAHYWGQRPNCPTCIAHNSRVDSRVDHIFLSSEIVPRARACITGEFGVFDVHAS
eukprot:5380496-Alexandrium_andersonii.AAC.1